MIKSRCIRLHERTEPFHLIEPLMRHAVPGQPTHCVTRRGTEGDATPGIVGKLEQLANSCTDLHRRHPMTLRIEQQSARCDESHVRAEQCVCCTEARRDRRY